MTTKVVAAAPRTISDQSAKTQIADRPDETHVETRQPDGTTARNAPIVVGQPLQDAELISPASPVKEISEKAKKDDAGLHPATHDQPARKKPKFLVPRIVVPSEPSYGGKTRLGPYILPYSPIRTGNKCIDVCGGLGNLTWQARKLGFKFDEWIINDPIQLRFFRAVRAIGHKIKVPPRSREEFERQRDLAANGDQRAIALAPWLSYNGGGYGYGGSAYSGRSHHSGSGNSAERRNGHRTAGGRRTTESEERNLHLMHKFLNDDDIRLSGLDWRDCLEKEHPGPKDLILIDGPYVDCKTGAYEPDTFIPIEVIDYLKSDPNLNWLFCEYIFSRSIPMPLGHQFSRKQHNSGQQLLGKRDRKKESSAFGHLKVTKRISRRLVPSPPECCTQRFEILREVKRD